MEYCRKWTFPFPLITQYCLEVDNLTLLHFAEFEGRLGIVQLICSNLLSSTFVSAPEPVVCSIWTVTHTPLPYLTERQQTKTISLD